MFLTPNCFYIQINPFPTSIPGIIYGKFSIYLRVRSLEKNMSFIQSVIIFLALMVFFHWAFSKHDKRWEGVRLCFKGGILLGVGALLAGLSDLLEAPVCQVLKVADLLLFLVGLALGFWGMTKHWKIMFAPTTDLRAEIDPGYQLDYVLCPHCKGASIRRDARPFRCPICKKKPNRK